MTKPGARRPCLVKNKIKIDDPGASRLTGGYKNPQHGSRCLDGNVGSVVQWQMVPPNAA